MRRLCQRSGEQTKLLKLKRGWGRGDPNGITAFAYMDTHCTDGESVAQGGAPSGFKALKTSCPGTIWAPPRGGERGGLSRTAMDSGQ